ncbi:MAG: T9SS type A sorting domain-containing protein [Taibaiella sp.]|nr:T9SS type A sorting domain-containing protein [Taibaiella sp.]
MKHNYPKGKQTLNAYLKLLALSSGSALKKLLAICFLVFLGTYGTYAQNCTANAGGNATVCGSTTTLVGSVSGTLGTLNTPLWTFISGPVTPTIVSPDNLTTNITGMTADGNYTFRLTRNCGTGVATSDVTITAHPRPVSFTAGPDVTNICATTGTTPLAGVIPAGFTGSWRSVNIFSLARFSTVVSTNSQFSSTSIATPDFSLINKVNHDIDPAYYAILRITSNDGTCSYEDTAIVNFIPNPNIILPANTNTCAFAGYNPTTYNFSLTSSSPAFSTAYAGSAGTAANGNTVTLNVVSQPAGGNLSLGSIESRMVILNGITTSGSYVFTLTVSNACGTYTTSQYTYTVGNPVPYRVNFQPAGHGAPEQLVIYSFTGTGGEHHCNSMVGTTTPETFYFDLNALDSPTVYTTVTPSGTQPPGGYPSVVVSGAGTRNRMATVTPPAGGWQVGTYKFNVLSSYAADMSCPDNRAYYIHVSDNARPNVSIPDISVCYPGTGAISANVPLPAVYKGAVNSSYFQDFDGQYNFSVVSKPAGSGTPAFTGTNLRSLTSTSTTISNLTMAGDYVFRVVSAPYTASVGDFIGQEYACSGTSNVDTFVVHVENPVNANAGSDQIISCTNSLTLLGNSPGSGTGLWSEVAVPAGSTATIGNVNTPNTTVSGINVTGTYTYKWTITSLYGGCSSSDTVSFVVNGVMPATPVTTVTPLPCSGAAGNITITSPVGAGYEYRAVSSFWSSAWQSAPSISMIAGGIYSVQVRYAASPVCVASKTDTLRQNYCGTVIDDANGDKLITSGENGTNAGGTLYVYAFNTATGIIDAVVPVAADGTFSISVTGDSPYTLKLSTAVYPVGANANTTPINTTPPAGWVTTGENRTGLAGGDGTPDGSMTIAKMFTGRGGLVFGIQRPPVADSKTFNVEQTSLSLTPPAGFPLVTGYKSILASSPDLTGYNGSGGSLSGTDPEDCAGVSACRSNTGTTFVINTINANTKLYYDFGAGAVAIDVTSGPVSIPNFDATKLAIYGQGGAGTTGSEIGFDYSITDKAGVSSPSVPYRISTTTPLPTRLLLFTANKEGDDVVLDWATAMEQNSKGFDIERSAEGTYWTRIGNANSKAINGNSNLRLDYSFTDKQPLNGKNIYRLKQLDFDGKFEYSAVVSVMQQSKSGIIVYPNPVAHELIVDGIRENDQVRIYNLLGQELSVNAIKTGSNKVRLNVSALANSVYFVVVTGEEDKVILRQRFVKQ